MKKPLSLDALKLKVESCEYFTVGSALNVIVWLLLGAGRTWMLWFAEA